MQCIAKELHGSVGEAMGESAGQLAPELPPLL